MESHLTQNQSFAFKFGLCHGQAICFSEFTHSLTHPSIHSFTNIAGISDFLKMKIINEGSFPSWRQGVYGVGVKGRLSPAQGPLEGLCFSPGKTSFCLL